MSGPVETWFVSTGELLAPNLKSVTIRPVETTETIYARTASENVRDFIVNARPATNSLLIFDR